MIVQAWKYGRFIFTYTNPEPKGIPSSACAGTSSLENPVQKAESLEVPSLESYMYTIRVVTIIYVCI